MALAPLGAHAQRWSVQTGIGSELLWSSNTELGVAGGREDTILNVRPRISILTQGARSRLGGTAALNAVTSANGTQPSRLLPEADLRGRLEAVERLIFLDAGVRAQQISQNPFGARPDAATTRNSLTAASANFSPSLEKDFDAATRVRLRSDNSWTRESGADDTASVSSAEGYFARHSALAERDPLPLGWRLEAERSRTEYRDDLQPSLKLDLVRASGLYQVDADLTVGVRVGAERTSLLPDDPNKPIYGVEARWQPSPRTTLEGFEEKRFFGNSWRLGLNHRRPRMALNAVVSRSLDTTPQNLFELPPFDNVATLLDSVLLSRFPDPLERAELVREIIDRQGLPAQTLSPITLFVRRVSVVTTRQVSVAVLGLRNTLTLSAFNRRTEDATQGDSLLVADEAFANNTQRGASVALSHRLTQNVALNVVADWSQIRALQSPDRSIERAVRVRTTAQIAPRTAVFAGARYRELASSVSIPGREGAVFVGFDHQF